MNGDEAEEALAAIMDHPAFEGVERIAVITVDQAGRVGLLTNIECEGCAGALCQHSANLIREKNDGICEVVDTSREVLH